MHSVFPISSVDGGRYKITRSIAKGSFGQVFAGIDQQTQKEVAIKIEMPNSKSHILMYEYSVYKSFKSSSFIPEIYWIGSSNNHTVMVMELLGSSLYQMLQICNGKFTLSTTLLLAMKMLKCVEYVHKFGCVHHDLKPENFLLRKDQPNEICLIDYGLSYRYLDPASGAHIGYMKGCSFTGNARFASINSLDGIGSSRRDDIESLLYIWMYFLKGDLPWISLGGSNPKENQQLVLETKQKIKPEKLFKDCPPEFSKIYYYIKQMRFNDAPNYQKIENLLIAAFKTAFPKVDINKNITYDWNNT